MKKLSQILSLTFLIFPFVVKAQSGQPQIKDQMVFLGAYNAGQPGVNIYKMFDPVEDVICYILMPVIAGRKAIEGGAFIYDGNTIGSMSCMKAKALPVSIKPIDKK